MKKRKKNILLKTIVILLFGIVICIFIRKAYLYIQIKDAGVSDVNVEDYYSNNSEIVKKYRVKDSDNLQTESQAIEYVTQRGFVQDDLSYEYDIRGKYIGETSASETTAKHPIYQTLYISPSGDIWSVFIIDGSIIANPVTYNIDYSNLKTQTVISETETIIGFDSKNNVFYEVIPNEDVLTVKIVERIDANFLDSLTNEMIDGL